MHRIEWYIYAAASKVGLIYLFTLKDYEETGLIAQAS
jgi:hypothetical protein